MRFFILFLIPINILLAYDAPALPPKEGRYEIRDNRVVKKPPSIKRYLIKSYVIGGKIIYDCGKRARFLSYGEALTFCQKLNRFEASKRERHSMTPRPSLLDDEKTISGTNKSPLRQSLMESRNNLPGKGNFITNYKKGSDKNIIGNTEKEFSPAKKMNKHTNSYLLWKEVWNGCSILCYTEHHFKQYKNLILAEINNYRSYHGGAYLVSSPQLNELAQKLAEKYAKKQKLKVDPYAIYGTIYARVQIYLASRIVKSCYDTKGKYSFYFNKPVSRTALSFTQIVWVSTKKFGIGVHYDSGSVYVVLLFLPRGNIRGEFKENVFKFKR